MSIPSQETSPIHQTPPLWFATDGTPFRGDEPFFYNPEDFPWVRTLEENYPAIKAEVEALLARQDNRLQPYFNNSLVFPPRSWKTLGFQFWTFRMHRNCRDCPTIAKVLESIPGCTAGSVSMLEPNAKINPHNGDTNAIIRVHLGLDIPEGLPNCGFQVGDEVHAWEEGRVLLFCDAHHHTAFNNSDKSRTIMILDVMRPEFLEQQSRVCSRVFSAILVQMVTQGRKVSRRSRKRLLKFFYFSSRVFLPVQRSLGKFLIR